MLDDAAVSTLEGLAARYAAAPHDQAALRQIGRELYEWVDGGSSQLATLRDIAGRLWVLEIRGPRTPTTAEWALLRAPLEMLADSNGFLTHDALSGFSVLRRLGSPATNSPALDSYRLRLAFMASAPCGNLELDYEAEETALLTAVENQDIDLLVEDSGDSAAGAAANHARQVASGAPVLTRPQRLASHGRAGRPFPAGTADGRRPGQRAAGRRSDVDRKIPQLRDAQLVLAPACLTIPSAARLPIAGHLAHSCTSAQSQARPPAVFASVRSSPSMCTSPSQTGAPFDTRPRTRLSMATHRLSQVSQCRPIAPPCRLKDI